MPALDTLEALPIGGIDQWVRIRSRDSTHPLLLVLYGGPGLPLLPHVRALGEDAGLEERFTVAYWEQRGSGKTLTRATPSESMSIDRYVADVLELSDCLRDRFDQERVFLLGESWGTVLGLRAVARSPERFWAHVGTGQIVDALEGDRHSYRFAVREARRRGHSSALRDLRALGPPPYTPRELMRQRKWVGAFGGIRRDTEAEGPLGMLRDLLTTPAYSWGDLWTVATRPFFALHHLLQELYEVDLAEEITQVDVPVYFFEGRHDRVTPPTVVEPFYRTLQAPYKAWRWFDDAAHCPFFEQPERFGEAMATVRDEVFDP